MADAMVAAVGQIAESDLARTTQVCDGARPGLGPGIQT